MEQVKLLTEAQREILPRVMIRRNQFKNLIFKSITNRYRTFSNGILISGKPGSGKTTLITEFLEELVTDGSISDYSRVSGHVTKMALFEYLRPQLDDAGHLKSVVHLMDDVDCLYDGGCLEILKSALDTRSEHATNRVVYYNSGTRRDKYKYEDFAIIITNDQFDYTSTHLQAVLDRVHLFKIDMEYDDFVIFNTYLIEKYLNDNPDSLDEDVIKRVADFYTNEVIAWFDCNAFLAANINFSIRLIRKFIDLMTMFGDDWKTYSIDYKKLTAVTKAPTK